MNTVIMPLSSKERRFLDLVDQGKSYKEICSLLNIKMPTAKTYVRRIVAKTFGAAGIHHAAYMRWQSGDLRQETRPALPTKLKAA